MPGAEYSVDVYIQSNGQPLACVPRLRMKVDSGVAVAARTQELPALEAMAYRVQDVLLVMQKDAEMELQEMLVDGGAAMNNFLLQFQADISKLDIIRPQNIESTAMGAAFAAGLAVEFWEDRDELSNIKEHDRIFTPQMSEEKSQELYKGWLKAVDQCLGKD